MSEEFDYEFSCDLSVLIDEDTWESVLEVLPSALRSQDIEPVDISARVVSEAVEPSDLLVMEYLHETGRMPEFERVYRVIVNGHTELDLDEIAAAVMECFPSGIKFQASSELGHTEFGLGEDVVWTAPDWRG